IGMQREAQPLQRQLAAGLKGQAGLARMRIVVKRKLVARRAGAADDTWLVERHIWARLYLQKATDTSVHCLTTNAAADTRGSGAAGPVRIATVRALAPGSCPARP